MVRDDLEIDRLEQQVSTDAVRMLALRQPMANDLREIVSALKVSSDLERIGDYAANVAKRSIALAQLPSGEARPVPCRDWRAWCRTSSRTRSTPTSTAMPPARAGRLARDEEVDEVYTGLFRELLTYMMEDPRNISPCTHLMFIAKNVERIGDHATNIAETVHYLVTGKPIAGGRPNGDASPVEVMEPPVQE